MLSYKQLRQLVHPHGKSKGSISASLDSLGSGGWIRTHDLRNVRTLRNQMGAKLNEEALCVMGCGWQLQLLKRGPH